MAGTLAAHDITRHQGSETVLDRVSVVVPPRARIGVVGPNGVGKSTLLQILGGLEEPDSGSVTWNSPTLTVGYLPQEVDARPDETLLDYLERRTGIAAAAGELDRHESELECGRDVAVAHAEALERFLALGGADFDARARAAVGDVGLDPRRLSQQVGTLSGGEAARTALAAILLARFDVLLLDEPTNDLDFAGLDLLERFLTRTESALVLVSHDRVLLDRSVTRVVELDEWTRGAREYAGGFREYEAQRARAREAEYERFGRYVAEREQIEEQLRTKRDWIERAPTQRRKKKTRDVSGRFERKLERLERVQKPYEPWELRLSIQARKRSAEVVARLDAAVVERGPFRLGPVDLELRWQDRLAVVGPNGSGKSTLLHALLGRLPLRSGQRAVGPGVVAGELEQGRETFASADPLLAVFTRITGLSEESARTLLAKFDLGAGDVLRPADSLSPGERTRAALASFTAREVNLLVLDEPTNHLDLPAIEQLEGALRGFDGTAIVVSHDRRFLEAFGATRTLELDAVRPGAAVA